MTDSVDHIRVTGINIYPIKSTAGIAVDACAVEGVTVCYAGVADAPGGGLATAGGRVLAIQPVDCGFDSRPSNHPVRPPFATRSRFRA